MSATDPLDQPARERISFSLNDTLFVEAGAGSGKTTQLVARIVNMIRVGFATIDQIAAISFTEKSAQELRHRLRSSLGELASSPEDPEGQRRAAAALFDLDGAAIGTLHNFARRIISAYSYELTLAPIVFVSDPTSYQYRFAEGWWEFFNSYCELHPEMDRILSVLWTFGVEPEEWVSLAHQVDNLRYLFVIGALRVGPARLCDDIVGQFHDIASKVTESIDGALGLLIGSDSDGLAVRLNLLDEEVKGYFSILDEQSIVEQLAEIAGRTTQLISKTLGKKDNWSGDKVSVAQPVRDSYSAFVDLAHQVVGGAGNSMVELALDYAEQAFADRKARGELSFDDMLILAVRAVADPEVGDRIASELAQRYRFIFLDEFQDTDPLQQLLALRIAQLPTQPTVGSEMQLRRGHLFIVGDPKQSIYRFRRADLSVYFATKGIVETHDSTALLSLSSNFRSAASIVHFANTIFQEMFGSWQSTDRYSLGDSAMTSVHDDPDSPSVVVIGREAIAGDKVSQAELGQYEAEGVITSIQAALRPEDPWLCRGSDGKTRPLRYGDIVILVPTRPSARTIERYLDEAEIPFRSSAATAVFSQERVKDLMVILMALCDPTNALAVVSALRCSSFGLTDTDLYRYVQSGGSWDLSDQQPTSQLEASERLVDRESTDRVEGAMDRLRHLSKTISLDGVYASVREVIGRCQLHELAVISRNAREELAGLRAVSQLAASYESGAQASMVGFVNYLKMLSQQRASVAESLVPDTDSDAVTIMTIHAAKGLEFPMVVVAGQFAKCARSNSRESVRLFSRNGEAMVKTTRSKTSDWDSWLAEEFIEEIGESLRLSYVAYTRAKDHLVVSVVRSRDVPIEDISSNTSYGELLGGAVCHSQLGVDISELEAQTSRPAAEPIRTERRGRGLMAYEEWRDQIEIVRSDLRRPRSVGVTRLGGSDLVVDAGVLAKESTERYGLENARVAPEVASTLGRVVHQVLAEVSLKDPKDVALLVRRLCVVAGVTRYSDVVSSSVNGVLEHPRLKRYAQLPHAKEVYVGAPSASDVVLEGYIDLLVDNGESMVVVDYKTTPNHSVEEFFSAQSQLSQYVTQACAYGYLVQRVAGKPVEEVVLIVAGSNGTGEFVVNDLSGHFELVRAAHEGLG